MVFKGYKSYHPFFGQLCNGKNLLSFHFFHRGHNFQAVLITENEKCLIQCVFHLVISELFENFSLNQNTNMRISVIWMYNSETYLRFSQTFMTYLAVKSS